MPKMTPYYADDLVTLYHGDCMDVLPGLGLFDLTFTSPPYNLSVTTGGGFAKAGPGGHRGWTHAALAEGYSNYDDAMPSEAYEEWQRDVLTELWDRTSSTGAIFYNHKPRVQAKMLWTPLVLNPALPIRQIIIWARPGGMNFAPTHYLPTYEWIIVFARPEWRLKSRAASAVGDLWCVPREANSDHPAPFPVGLPARAIESAEPKNVLDPFAGSGSTLVAAKAAGVRAVGIELSERYCEIAARRCSQEVLGLVS